MNDIKLGTVAAALQANGYSPCSIHGGVGFRFAEESAAVLCVPKDGRRTLGALTVTTKAKRAEVLAILERHGLTSGPQRTDCAGNIQFVVALLSYETPKSRNSETYPGESDPALAFDSVSQIVETNAYVSAMIRLDGDWNKPLTEIAYDKLPSLDVSVDKLFLEVNAVLSKPFEYKAPPVSAARKAEMVKEAALDAEIATRTDAAIWIEVEDQIRQAPLFGSSPWERDEHQRLIESPANRMRIYDALVAKRDGALAARARQGRRAGQLEEHLKSA